MPAAALLASAAAAASGFDTGAGGWAGWDTVHRQELRRAAFGSCSRVVKLERGDQLEQPLWGAISDFDPQLWVWVGDAVYPPHGSSVDPVGALRDAYGMQLRNPGYAKLLDRGPEVEGTWDDHDYGRNDAGAELPFRQNSQRAFLDFLTSSQLRAVEARRGGRAAIAAADASAASPQRVERDGVYSAHLWDGGEGRRAAVILLDTRSGREPYHIPSVGAWRWLPAAPLVAAATRWLSAALGLTRQHGAAMLTPQQWRWLEGALRAAEDCDVVFLVSSVQVLTSNPFVESWGHFPSERRRLLELLRANRSRGVTQLVSGDVHYAELLGTGSHPLEVTTSGMTHTCTGPWYGRVCPVMLRTYPKHRPAGLDTTTATQLNWMAAEVDWATEELRVSVRGADGAELISTPPQQLRRDAAGAWDAALRAPGPPEAAETQLVPALIAGALAAAVAAAVARSVWRRLRQPAAH
eukprot:TRINITY_DN13751_c0_g1_i1.p1 TRINITY_DN13751_c0_g1~~TRINITY_DN13751_c0_g1_i1.p1  ORF type:complete len:494 (+),score=131.21 TRINITY_DN13751_c0_g1_i1:87-1484(+)